MLRTRKTKLVSASLDRRRPRLRRHHQEAGGVVLLVLDVPRQHLEPVDLARELGGERRQARIARRRHRRRRPGGVRPGPRRDAVRAQERPALPEERRLAHRASSPRRAASPAPPAGWRAPARNARRRCAAPTPAGGGGCRRSARRSSSPPAAWRGPPAPRSPRRSRPRSCCRPAPRARETPRGRPGANRRRAPPGTKSCRSASRIAFPRSRERRTMAETPRE